MISRKLIPGWLKWIILRMHLNRTYKGVQLMRRARTDFKTVFGGMNVIQRNTRLFNSHMGYGSYIAGNSYLNNVHIGKFCSIGSKVENSFAVHPSRDFVSTHPVFYSTKKQAGFTFVQENSFQEHKYIQEGGRSYMAVIGNDVWIGSHVLIMPGVRIGDGAILATGSVVTSDVEPYTIVGGVPAKPIRKRFSEEQIAFLQTFRWWDQSPSWLAEHAAQFQHIDHLMAANT